MFQSFHWNRLAATVFRQEQPYIVFLESDAGVALIPTAIQNGRHLCLLGEELFDYRDVLWAGDRCVFAEAWDVVAETGLLLAETPVRGPAAPRHWSAFELAPFCKAPCVPSSVTSESFAAAHPRAARLIRRLERCGVRMERHRGDNRPLLGEIYTRKAAPSNDCGGNLFQDPRRADFLLDIAADPRSGCQIFTLESPSALVAALVTFVDGHVRRFYTTWFNPEWSRYSPGVALLFEATRLSLADGLGCDYMTGEQDYKLRLATDAVPLYRASGVVPASSRRAPETELRAAS